MVRAAPHPGIVERPPAAEAPAPAEVANPIASRGDKNWPITHDADAALMLGLLAWAAASPLALFAVYFGKRALRRLREYEAAYGKADNLQRRKAVAGLWLGWSGVVLLVCQVGVLVLVCVGCSFQGC